MSDVVVVARARAKEGKEEESAAAFLAAIPPTLNEEGCIYYALHRGADDPQVLIMIERWLSRADLERHLAAPHIARLFGQLADLLDGAAEITVLEPLSDDLSTGNVSLSE